MKNRTWDVEYQTYQIRAIHNISLFPPKISENLEINGVIVESIQGSFLRSCSTIFTKYSFNGTDREIEVRFAKKPGIGSMGCQIFVDGQKIGGDRTIKYPDPRKSAEYIKKGFIHYLLSIGLLSYGLPIAIGLGITDLGSPLLLRMGRFIIYFLVSSLIGSYFSWNEIGSMTKHRQNYNQAKYR